VTPLPYDRCGLATGVEIMEPLTAAVGAEKYRGWLGVQNLGDVRFCGRHLFKPHLGK
jgi:hypothetical protein